MVESWTFEAQEDVRPEFSLREMEKPNYKTVWSFRFDPEAKYFRLERETKTDTGYARDGKGMVEFKRDQQGEYSVRYLRFGALKQWGQEGRYASRKSVPAAFQSLIAEKRAELTMNMKMEGMMQEDQERLLKEQLAETDQSLQQEIDENMKMRTREELIQFYQDTLSNPWAPDSVKLLYRNLLEQIIEQKKEQ